MEKEILGDEDFAFGKDDKDLKDEETENEGKPKINKVVKKELKKQNKAIKKYGRFHIP